MGKLSDAFFAVVRRPIRPVAEFPAPDQTLLDVPGGPSFLSDLAGRIYQVLRRRAPGEDPRITYLELFQQLGTLPPPNHDLGPLDQRLHDALDEVARACRRRGLPALTALVVRRDDRTPGADYYAGAHPGAGDDPATRLAIWRSELLAAISTTYPATL